MLTFVTWKWTPPRGYRSTFGPETVNTLKRMVDRHYHAPHRFLCVTDNSSGIDADVEIVQPWNDFTQVPSPSGGRNPSCYRRLRAFAPDIGEVFGPRFVSLDLDVVVTGDLRPLFDRPEDFVIYGDTNPKTFYNGSLFVLTAGTRSQVWTSFDPVKSPQASRSAGHFGSDQGWLSHCLGPHEMKWTKADGVYSYQNDFVKTRRSELPDDARIVVFHGNVDPWSACAQQVKWVRTHYGMVGSSRLKATA